VLDPLFEHTADEIGRNCIGVEFMPGWRFGIDRHVYELVRRVTDRESAERLLGFLSESRLDSEGESLAEESSLGRDGHILIGGPDYSEKVWRRELA
jgi:hypothetical protein